MIRSKKVINNQAYSYVKIGTQVGTHFTNQEFNIGTSFSLLTQSLKDYERELGKVDESFRKIAESSKALDSMVNSHIASLFREVEAYGLLAGAVDTFILKLVELTSQFEQQAAYVSTFANIGENKNWNNQDIVNIAGNISSQTLSHMDQVLGAMRQFAQSGIEGESNIANAALTSAKFMSGTGTDENTSAGLAVTLMNAMNLKGNDLSEGMDYLTSAINRTNLQAGDIAETLKYTAPIFSTLGIKIDEAMGIVGALANADIKGSLAGTSVRMIMTKLVDFQESINGTGSASAILKQLFPDGINYVDSAGNLDLEKALTTIAMNVDNLTMNKAGAMQELFGQRAYASVLRLIDKEDGEFVVSKYINKVSNNAIGLTDDNSSNIMRTTPGILNRLTSQVSDIIQKMITPINHAIGSLAAVGNSILAIMRADYSSIGKHLEDAGVKLWEGVKSFFSSPQNILFGTAGILILQKGIDVNIKLVSALTELTSTILSTRSVNKIIDAGSSSGSHHKSLLGFEKFGNTGYKTPFGFFNSMRLDKEIYNALDSKGLLLNGKNYDKTVKERKLDAYDVKFLNENKDKVLDYIRTGDPKELLSTLRVEKSLHAELDKSALLRKIEENTRTAKESVSLRRESAYFSKTGGINTRLSETNDTAILYKNIKSDLSQMGFQNNSTTSSIIASNISRMKTDYRSSNSHLYSFNDYKEMLKKLESLENQAKREYFDNMKGEGKGGNLESLLKTGKLDRALVSMVGGEQIRGDRTHIISNFKKGYSLGMPLLTYKKEGYHKVTSDIQSEVMNNAITIDKNGYFAMNKNYRGGLRARDVIAVDPGNINNSREATVFETLSSKVAENATFGSFNYKGRALGIDIDSMARIGSRNTSTGAINMITVPKSIIANGEKIDLTGENNKYFGDLMKSLGNPSSKFTSKTLSAFLSSKPSLTFDQEELKNKLENGILGEDFDSISSNIGNGTLKKVLEETVNEYGKSLGSDLFLTKEQVEEIIKKSSYGRNLKAQIEKGLGLKHSLDEYLMITNSGEGGNLANKKITDIGIGVVLGNQDNVINGAIGNGTIHKRFLYDMEAYRQANRIFSGQIELNTNKNKLSTMVNNNDKQGLIGSIGLSVSSLDTLSMLSGTGSEVFKKNFDLVRNALSINGISNVIGQDMFDSYLETLKTASGRSEDGFKEIPSLISGKFSDIKNIGSRGKKLGNLYNDYDIASMIQFLTKAFRTSDNKSTGSMIDLLGDGYNRGKFEDVVRTIGSDDNRMMGYRISDMLSGLNSKDIRLLTKRVSGIINDVGSVFGDNKTGTSALISEVLSATFGANGADFNDRSQLKQIFHGVNSQEESLFNIINTSVDKIYHDKYSTDKVLDARIYDWMAERLQENLVKGRGGIMSPDGVNSYSELLMAKALRADKYVKQIDNQNNDMPKFYSSKYYRANSNITDYLAYAGNRAWSSRIDVNKIPEIMSFLGDNVKSSASELDSRFKGFLKGRGAYKKVLNSLESNDQHVVETYGGKLNSLIVNALLKSLKSTGIDASAIPVEKLVDIANKTSGMSSADRKKYIDKTLSEINIANSAGVTLNKIKDKQESSISIKSIAGSIGNIFRSEGMFRSLTFSAFGALTGVISSMLSKSLAPTVQKMSSLELTKYSAMNYDISGLTIGGKKLNSSEVNYFRDEQREAIRKYRQALSEGKDNKEAENEMIQAITEARNNALSSFSKKSEISILGTIGSSLTGAIGYGISGTIASGKFGYGKAIGAAALISGAVGALTYLANSINADKELKAMQEAQKRADEERRHLEMMEELEKLNKEQASYGLGANAVSNVFQITVNSSDDAIKEIERWQRFVAGTRSLEYDVFSQQN